MTDPINASRSSRTFLVERLHKIAIVPTRGSEEAAGLDLHACFESLEKKISATQFANGIYTNSAGMPIRFTTRIVWDAKPKPYDPAPTLTKRVLESFILGPGQNLVVPTGIAMTIPAMHYGRIAARSGLAVNHCIDVMAGVIDSDYRGEVCVILRNSHPTNHFSIFPGDRIAQIIIEPYSNIMPVMVGELPKTARGSNGFGSTGVSVTSMETRAFPIEASTEMATSLFCREDLPPVRSIREPYLDDTMGIQEMRN